MARAKRQSPIINVMIILIGLIAGYLFYSSSTIEEVSDVVQSSGLFLDGEQDVVKSSPADLEYFANMSFDFSKLDNNSYKALVSIGDKQVVSGLTGRANPFSRF